MNADPFHYAPLIISLFVQIQVTAVPGVQHVCIFLQHIADVVDFTQGMITVCIQFDQMIKDTVVRRSPSQVTDHTVFCKLPGVTHKSAVIICRFRPIGRFHLGFVESIYSPAVAFGDISYKFNI